MATAPFEPTRVVAPAKVNLALHVLRRRDDGYHDLDSLVAFAPAIADVLTIRTAEGDWDRLAIDGPFAATVPDGPDNLVLRALAFARARIAATGTHVPPLHVTLTKRLPVAAGIGGGSADAAALLRSLVAAYPAAANAITRDCVRLGADVPVCLSGRPARMSGIGERISPPTALPDLPLLLVNPGIPVSTAAVFAALARHEREPMPAIPADGFATLSDLVEWLQGARNDLEGPAREIAPQIDRTLDALDDAGARLARLSGSGATVFAIFDDEDVRNRAAADLSERHPNWWIAGHDACVPALA